jgi:uncharacterized membrane protein
MTVTALETVKMLHLFAFVGCLTASVAKTWVLRPVAITLSARRTLVVLDRISGLSAVIIAITGAAMLLWLAKPTAFYLANMVFWAKVAIVVIATGLVLRTKGPLRAAARDVTTRWLVPAGIRNALKVDLGSIIIMAIMGRWIATQLT